MLDKGYYLPTHIEESLQSKVRGVIESDLDQSWQAAEIAQQLSMSESTLRRRLAKNNQSFSKVLLNTRLERVLQRSITDKGFDEIKKLNFFL